MLPKPQKTLVDRVFDGIFTMVQDGDIPLGGVVNEVALAEHFEVSRGPVREAVKRLQGKGLVVKEPYRKAHVVDLSVGSMVQIFQLREAVEGMSVRLATHAISEAELDALLSQFAAAGEQQKPEVLDVHVRIAEASGNERIRNLLCDELYYLLRIYRARSGALPGRRNTALSEHWQILRAMKARDADLAESLMRAHIARATEGLQDLLDRQAKTVDQSNPVYESMT